MKPFRLCYFSAHSMEIPSLSAGVKDYEKKYGKIKVIARTGKQLFDRSRIEAFINDALLSDAVILVLHGGSGSCAAFDGLVTAISGKRKQGEKTPYFHIHPQGSDDDGIISAKNHSDDFGGENWNTLNLYLVHGGRINFCNLLVFLHNLLFKGKTPVDPPAQLPQEGIYHPDIFGPADFEKYLREKIDPAKITVGIWFYQSFWLNDNLAYVDAMIREVERRGANVICVFHLRYKDKARGNRGAAYVAEKFFKKDGRPIIDVLINPMLFSLTLSSPGYKKILSGLDVPFIQAITTLTPYAEWKDSPRGISTMDVSYAVAQPEFDGALITVPVSTREEEDIDPVTGALVAKNKPVKERVRKMVSLAINWARLKQKKNKDKKVAIIFHNYPPRNDRIGCAAGLDSFESVRLLLSRMKDADYKIDEEYEKSDDLARKILDGVTCDRRWLTADKMAEKSVAFARRDVFTPWHENLPPSVKRKMDGDWGEMPGDIFVHEDAFLFPGFINGNVFITIQPPRGYFENIDKIYHDFYLSPPHHYLAFYRWIKLVFRADAVIHVGKHGSLEWLPGKALGLSETCYPDLSIMDLPNIYPYIINDPSEGTQAKRRSYCCIIDHLTPAFTNADLYEELAGLENHMVEYNDAKTGDPGKLHVLKAMIWDDVEKASLHKDLEITKDQALGDFETFLEKLHAYLSELSDTMIGDGLHVLGCPPEKERLVEFLVQLTRLSNGDIPSLREAVLNAMGYQLDFLMENRGKRIFGARTGGQIIEEGHKTALLLVKNLMENDLFPNAAEKAARNIFGKPHENIVSALDYISTSLVPRIKKTTDELDFCLKALDGNFVLPGPSGAPTRGQADILPTGRNFYSVDPNKIPSPAAWETGKKLGDALIERYLEETGKYPDTIGIIVWGGPTMRTKGDDIAEIFYLMGIKPVWARGSGNVTGLEVIPRAELGRPRLDVVPRISGFFRDCFPNLVARMDEAARMVASLNELWQENILRRNVHKDMEDYMKGGMTRHEAMREATFRVFGCPPGTYGAGVAELVESKNWKNRDDLGNNYIRYTAHAYGQGSYGDRKTKSFRKILSRMDCTVKNEDSREYDMMSCTDFYNYYGGLIVAAKTVRGRLPFAVVGDSADPERIKIRTTFEEAKHVLRARLTNPKWIEGVKRHGYKGAGDLSKMMEVVLGWDATAQVVDDWMYERMARKYALDPEMQKWMKKVNPYALQNILDKLIEAISRGMWNADPHMEQKLRDAYLEAEGEIEEITE